MKNIILIVAFCLFIIMFCGTEFTLRYFLPDTTLYIANTKEAWLRNWAMWLDYFRIRDAAYDLMFFISSTILYALSKTLLKALATFALVITGGSVVDKIILGINDYLITDIILVALGIYLGWKVYRKEKQNG